MTQLQWAVSIICVAFSVAVAIVAGINYLVVKAGIGGNKDGT